MSTSFEEIRQRFLRKIEKDRDFFKYYNVADEEAIELAIKQSDGYIIDSIDELTNQCTPDIDFYNYNENLKVFNFELTKKEIGILTSLMRQVYFERDFVTLKAFKIAMTPSDLNQFSPAQERKTFTEMVDKIKVNNESIISKYIAEDRITGKPKLINYQSFIEEG